MIKWIREDGEVIEFKIDSKINIYKNGEFVGESDYFYSLKDGHDKILEFTCKIENGYFKYGEKLKMRMTDSDVNQRILDVKSNNEKTINDFFDNLVEQKFEEHHGHFYIIENEYILKLKERDIRYFESRLRKFIEENKKYMIKTGEEIVAYSEGERYYLFDVKIKERKLTESESYKCTDEYKKHVEKNVRFNELCDLAENMNDVEFEDLTGLQRDHYLI